MMAFKTEKVNMPFAVKDCALIARMAGIDTALNLRELRERLKIAPVECLFHHFCETQIRPTFDDPEFRNDFAIWTARELHDRVLAERLGISRTPIREAIMRLEQEGFLEIAPRRGVYIKRKSLGEILEMITVWAALESMAARLACEHASDAEIARLRQIGTQFTKDNAKAHLSEYSEANIDFHLCVLGMSK